MVQAVAVAIRTTTTTVIVSNNGIPKGSNRNKRKRYGDPTKAMLKTMFTTSNERSAYNFMTVVKEISRYCAQNIEDGGLMMKVIDKIGTVRSGYG